MPRKGCGCDWGSGGMTQLVSDSDTIASPTNRALCVTLCGVVDVKLRHLAPLDGRLHLTRWLFSSSVLSRRLQFPPDLVVRLSKLLLQLVHLHAQHHVLVLQKLVSVHRTRRILRLLQIRLQLVDLQILLAQNPRGLIQLALYLYTSHTLPAPNSSSLPSSSPPAPAAASTRTAAPGTLPASPPSSSAAA